MRLGMRLGTLRRTDGIVSRPALRWLVPVGVAIVILAAGAATSAINASAGAGLAPRTAAQLLTDLETARLSAASGTLVEHADVIPALPDGVGGEGSSQFDSLITGSHTLRIWYDGPQRDRIALIGTLGESDIIHNGPDLWIWSSTDNTVTHVSVPNVAPTAAGRLPHSIASAMPSALPSALTPSAIADDILAALSPTTSVTTGPSTTVAGRPAYELVVAPKDPASLIGSIRIAIDASTYVPLRVQVFAVGDAKPAFELGYSQISYAKPDPAVFGFNPPPGVTTRQLKPSAGSPAPNSPTPSSGGAPTLADPPRVIGSGWTAIVSGPMPFMDKGPGGQGDQTIDALTKALPTIAGPWGKGKLLETKLFSALLTSDGRIFIGAVSGDRLVAAVSK